MPRPSHRYFVKRWRPLLLLGLLLLVQLWSAYATVDAIPPQSRRGALLVADALVIVIGVAMTLLGTRAPRRRFQKRAPERGALRVKLPPEPTVSAERLDGLLKGTSLLDSASSAAGAKAADEPPEESAHVSAMLQELAHRAQHDSLTGLPNRSLALDRLQQAIRRAERHRHPVAVMFADLNGFKPINDTFGHDFGDKVLRKTAERLKRSVREADTVARLGGDEFLVILEQCTEDKALSAAQTLATIVEQPVAAVEGPVSVTMSIGIAMYPQHGTSGRQLLRAADAAMYRSKTAENGRPILASRETAEESRTIVNRFGETTTINQKLLDTWRGTLRGLGALGE